MNLSKRLLACAAFLSLAVAGIAAPWKFVVTGDDRSGSNRPEDQNGVNVVILAEMRDAFLAEKPDFVLFSGDLISGPRSDEEMESQLKTWFGVMDPVYKAGIAVYPIRGNHEMHVAHPEDVWKKMFVGAYAVPQNGPKGAEGFNYTVSHKNALIIGLDEFLVKGDESHIDQKWLDSVLETQKATHIFTFAHKMAFRSGHHDDGMELDPAARDTFIKSLMKAGERVVFFGHDHLYDHRTLTLTGSTSSIEQFVIGTAGAPLVKWEDANGAVTGWDVKKGTHVDGKYGYSVVEIDGDDVTITYKARSAPGKYEVADTFHYHLGQ